MATGPLNVALEGADVDAPDLVRGTLKGTRMFLSAFRIVAIVLLGIWAFDPFAFHVEGGLIHILLVVAIVFWSYLSCEDGLDPREEEPAMKLLYCGALVCDGTTYKRLLIRLRSVAIPLPFRCPIVGYSGSF